MAVEVDEDGVPRTFSQYEASIYSYQNSVRSASKEVIDRLSIGLDIVQVIEAEEREEAVSGEGRKLSSEKQTNNRFGSLGFFFVVWREIFIKKCITKRTDEKQQNSSLLLF